MVYAIKRQSDGTTTAHTFDSEVVRNAFIREHGFAEADERTALIAAKRSGFYWRHLIGCAAKRIHI